MPVFNGGNGGGMPGRREYSPESYGKSIASGGARKGPGGGGAAGATPQPFDPYAVREGPPRPQIPNLTPHPLPPTSRPTQPAGGGFQPGVGFTPPQTPNAPPATRSGGFSAPPGGPRFDSAASPGGNPEIGRTAGETDAVRAANGWDPTRQTNGGYPDGVNVQSLYANSPSAPAAGPVQYAPSVQAARDAGPTFSTGPAGGGVNLDAQVKAYGDIVGQDFKKSVGGMLGDLNGIGALRSGAVQSGLNDLTTTYGRQIGDYAAMTAGQQASLNQNESQFSRTFGLQQQQFGADDRFRNASLAQSGSQFDRNLAQTGSQFDRNLGEQDKEFQTNASYRQNQSNFDNADTLYERNFRDKQYADAQSASKKRGIGKILGGIAGGVTGFMAGGGPQGAIAGAKVGSSIFGG